VLGFASNLPQVALVQTAFPSAAEEYLATAALDPAEVAPARAPDALLVGVPLLHPATRKMQAEDHAASLVRISMT
jgi:hypothetical protein